MLTCTGTLVASTLWPGIWWGPVRYLFFLTWHCAAYPNTHVDPQDSWPFRAVNLTTGCMLKNGCHIILARLAQTRMRARLNYNMRTLQLQSTGEKSNDWRDGILEVGRLSRAAARLDSLLSGSHQRRQIVRQGTAQLLDWCHFRHFNWSVSRVGSKGSRCHRNMSPQSQFHPVVLS